MSFYSLIPIEMEIGVVKTYYYRFGFDYKPTAINVHAVDNVH